MDYDEKMVARHTLLNAYTRSLKKNKYLANLEETERPGKPVLISYQKVGEVTSLVDVASESIDGDK